MVNVCGLIGCKLDRTVLLALLVVSGCARDKGGQSGSAPTAARVSYEVVDQWRIPNGGYGRVIVIDPSHRNQTDMRALAEKLKQDTRPDRNAFIFIYDDKRAASLRKAAIADRLSKTDMADHDSHMIGSYMRNANTGHHALTISLEGVSGPSTEVKL